MYDNICNITFNIIKIYTYRLYLFQNMTRSHIKYQIAKDADDTSDYFLQPVQELSNISKKEISLWKKIFRTIILIFCYFILSVGLTFYVQWLYNTYVSEEFYNL